MRPPGWLAGWLASSRLWLLLFVNRWCPAFFGLEWRLTDRSCRSPHPSIQANGARGAGGDINRPIGVSDAVLAAVNAKWEALSKQRKKRPLPEVPSLRPYSCRRDIDGGNSRPRSLTHVHTPHNQPTQGLPSPQDLAGWSCKEEHAPHATAKPGVLALDILPVRWFFGFFLGGEGGDDFS